MLKIESKDDERTFRYLQLLLLPSVNILLHILTIVKERKAENLTIKRRELSSDYSLFLFLFLK